MLAAVGAAVPVAAARFPAHSRCGRPHKRLACVFVAELQKQIEYTPEDSMFFDLDMEERADKVRRRTSQPAFPDSLVDSLTPRRSQSCAAKLLLLASWLGNAGVR